MPSELPSREDPTMTAAQLPMDDPFTIDEAITYALDDVKAARIRAERSPNAESLAEVQLFEQALDILLDGRLAYPPTPAEAPRD